MRATLFTFVGFAAWAALLFGGCGDDTGRRAARDAGGAGGEEAGGEAAGTESQSGGSDGQASQAGGAETAAAGSGSGSAGESACPQGPDGEAVDDYLAQFASGGRLQARYYAAEGMPDVFAGFYDSELGQWCDFARASDDQLRCLPRSTSFSLAQGYSDATCETPVYTASAACASESGYVRVPLECSGKFRVHSLVPYDGTLYVGSPEQCAPSDGAPAPSSYTLGPSVTPSSLVKGELEELPGICRGSLRVVKGEDGSRGPYEAWDVPSGAGCLPDVAGCRPSRLAFEEPQLFSDDSCETAAETPYATWNDAESCGPPDFVRPLQSNDSWYRVGRASEAELYSGISGCKPAGEQPWIGSVWELGEEVPKTTLGPLEMLSLGEGALQVPALGEAGQPLIAVLGADARLYDAEAQQDCYLRALSDGTLRCIPTDIVSGSGFTDEYNDANCTQPVRRCSGDDCVGKLLHDQELDGTACSSERVTTAIWRVKAPATGYYRQDDTFPCYLGGEPGPDMWTVEAVDPDELSAASLETAP